MPSTNDYAGFQPLSNDLGNYEVLRRVSELLHPEEEMPSTNDYAGFPNLKCP
jgi:hypothetical protein